MDELRDWDGVETAERIRRREVGVGEVVEAAIDRAERVDPVVHGLVVATPEAARSQARDLDESLARVGAENLPALAGVPTAIKDLSDVAGVASRYGSRAIDGWVPTATGGEVEQLLATGLVSLGKSATPEFGFVATTEPLFGDATRNPWDLSRSAGGSSGGAGALVASGIVPLAHATDGGGSIRIPASVNGLVGLKPTVDRHVRMAKMDRLPVKISVSGVVTRTVRDTAAFLAAAERHHRNTDLPPIGDVHGPGRRRVRIGVVLDGPNAPVDPALVDATRRTADRLAQLGHHVAEVDRCWDAQLGNDFVLYWGGLALAQLTMLPRRMPDHFDRTQVDPFTATLAEHARHNLHRLPGAIRRLRRYDATYRAAFTDVDVLLTPTLAHLPPELGATSPELDYATLGPMLVDYVQFTPVQNITGAPAVSVPAGMHDGLPLGVQLAGLHGDERTLVELAYALEELAPWPRTAPLEPLLAAAPKVAGPA